MAVIYLCPADKRLSCPWEGYASEIKQHFESEHNELLFRTSSVQIDLRKLPENKLLCLDEDLYLMQACTEEGKIAIKLRYLGSIEAASKFQYEVTISVNKNTYRYEPSRDSYVVPRPDGWEFNIERLEEKVDTIICNLLLKTFKVEISIQPENVVSEETHIQHVNVSEEFHFRYQQIFSEEVEIRRKISDTSLTNFEEKVLEDISLIDTRIEELKRQESLRRREDNNDYMDRISQLDFPMLEDSFTNKYEEFKKAYENSETLGNISEEIDLNCASCNCDMLPPIYLCINNHNVCNNCKNIPCKKCEGAITDNKNVELENISRTHPHHCRYSADGCNEKLPYTELKAHEAKCNFCRYRCFTDECQYTGKFDHFENHVRVVHSSMKVVNTQRVEMSKYLQLYVINPRVGVFYCTAVVENDFVIWRAAFCGPSERTFSCEISFKGSKYKQPIFLKRKNNVWEVRKPISELKKHKAKEKNAVLRIISFDF